MADNADELVGSHDHALDRYARQILFEPLGVEGQKRLLASRAVLIGCGALGSVVANILVRAGLGHLRICDRDYIERDNLQRQILFDEDDVAANLPKAEAAARELRRINSEVTVEAVVTDVNHTNVAHLAENAQIILDGTDNFETRFLVNDLAVKTGRPWIYGAVIGATGLCMTVIPHDTPCLRCVFEEAPPPELNPTCDTAGVLASAVNLVASMQVIEAIKLLIGKADQASRHLLHVDAWAGRFTNLNVASADDGSDCPCCHRGEYEYLEGRMASSTTTLCGRDAVQIRSGRTGTIGLAAIAEKLRPVASGPVSYNPYLLKARLGECDVTLFPDGRAIIKGTSDPDRARSVYARYFGA